MFKNLLKSILPVILLKFINNTLSRSIKIIGEYSSWKQALNYSAGYNANIIFSNSKKSFLKVLNNKAEYERDSVLFYKENINYSLIKILDEISSRLKKTVNILDFGGSFASIYFQNKKFLNNNKFNWSVVEQKKIVHYVNSPKIKNKINIFYGNLNFYLTVKNYLKYHSPDLVLFSGVLQYLSKPFDILNFLISKKIKYFLILRTPFHRLTEQIKIQIVPKYIYKSSYPIRIFTETSFLEYFSKNNYRNISVVFRNEIIDNFIFKNFFFKLK
jgi:putative methyltransferase (TIGR04325 family)